MQNTQLTEEGRLKLLRWYKRQPEEKLHKKDKSTHEDAERIKASKLRPSNKLSVIEGEYRPPIKKLLGEGLSWRGVSI